MSIQVNTLWESFKDLFRRSKYRHSPVRKAKDPKARHGVRGVNLTDVPVGRLDLVLRDEENEPEQ